ncbi:MAG: class I SAM-dependent methyltransferase [Candidatus Omnitrophota bacterium]
MGKHILDILEFFNPWDNCDFSEKKRGLKQTLLIALKKLYFWGQKTILIRYYPVKKIIKKKLNKANLLEVGSGSLGLSRCLKKKIVGVDLKTTGPRYGNMSLVKADAAALPFRDNSFDFVVSVDMLEHIPERSRQKVVGELLRVCKKKAFIGVPCGELARKWEEKAGKVYNSALKKLENQKNRKNKFAERNIFLSEHSRYGLPEESRMKEYINAFINDADGKFSLNIIDNESTWVWYYGLLGDMKYNYLRWAVTTIFFIAFFEILCRVKWGGCYRKIFVIERLI